MSVERDSLIYYLQSSCCCCLFIYFYLFIYLFIYLFWSFLHTKISKKCILLVQRCQHRTTPICKIMTKNPYNLQTNPYNLLTPLRSTILVEDPAVTHPYATNKQNTPCCESFTFVLTKHSWCHCKLTTFRI